MNDVGAGGNEPRAAMARRAGLMTAAAFPIAIADRCAGVIEFYSHGVTEPNPEVSAMFATVGGQLAQYLERHASRAADGVRRWIDAAEAPLLALDADGRVLLANRNACALVGERSEARAVGSDWVDAAVAGAASATPCAPRSPAAARRARRRRRPAREVAARAAVRGRRRDRHVGDRQRPRGAGRRTRSRRGCGGRSATTSCCCTTSRSSACARGALVGARGAAALEDPVHGMISPADFIPVAEQCGLIDALGDWVLDAVCAQQATWAAQRAAPAHLLQRVADPAAPRATSSPACATGSARAASTPSG